MTTSEKEEIKLSKVIAPSFYNVHRDIWSKKHTHYALCGGRGSGKSSFVSIELILGIMADEKANGVVLRKIGQYLKDSVFEQLIWAIDILGVSEQWERKISVPELIFLPTGQKILFRGADNPRKLKSTKVSSGYIKYIWYEEADEFSGQEEIDLINQSLMRGGEDFICFYSYNPPKAADSWINLEHGKPRADRLFHRSSYLTVPKKWLGKAFLAEAEYLAERSPLRYKNEYLGEITGTGEEIFPNVTLRAITEEEIARFDCVCRGIDWGYGADPFVYLEIAYEKSGRRILIFNEFYRYGARLDEIASEIKRLNTGHYSVTADSAEPRSNDELRDRGIKVIGAKKGQGSVEHGIQMLRNLEEIVIDPLRCPEAAREFRGYKLLPDGNGGYRSGFPDKDNHTIDAARYALEEKFCRKSVSFIDRRKLGI